MINYDLLSGIRYENYLVEKEALRVEEMQNAEFDKKLAQEEVWIRQGISSSYS